jgi:hypothetical protein
MRDVNLLRRLDELAALRDGWLDGSGRSPATGAIGALRETTGELSVADAAPFRLYPTPEGGVQLEWRSGTIESSVDVKADLCVYTVEVDTATGETREREEDRLQPVVLLRMLRDGIDGRRISSARLKPGSGLGGRREGGRRLRPA